MEQDNRCPSCGAIQAADAPHGICPACLLRQALPMRPEAEADPLAQETPPTPAELASHFPELEIIELIGRGGMGAVYKVRQKRLDRLAALKILSPSMGQDPAFAERFDREAKALGKLNHPHIVTIYDSGQVDGLFYLLMEYVEGMSLRQLMLGRQITPMQALAIVPQICEGLQYAHEAGIVHRDIKPENILLDKAGQVKIADFGLAKLLTNSHPDLTLTEPGELMGTAYYMAPEQTERPQDVDHRADIYSLGVIFYQMLTGELPLGRFAAPSQKVQVDIRLDDVVLRTLEKEPQRRYQRASEVKTEVETISRTAPGPKPEEPALASPPPLPGTLASQSPRSRLWLELGVLGLVASLVLVGLGTLAFFALGSLWSARTPPPANSPWVRSPSRTVTPRAQAPADTTPPEAVIQPLGPLGTATLLRSFRHPGTAIGRTAISADGRRALTGGGYTIGDDIRLWDLNSGRELMRFRAAGHANRLSGLAFLPDGSQAVSTSLDGTARVWDLTTGQQVRQLDARLPITSMALSPDGRQLLTGARRLAAKEFASASDPDAPTLRLWNLATGEDLERFGDFRIDVDRVVFAPDGSRIAASSTKLLFIWDPGQSQPRRIPAPSAFVHCLAFSPDGTRLAAGCQDGTLHLWDVSSGAELAQWQAQKSSILTLAFSPDGRWILSAGGTARTPSPGNTEWTDCLLHVSDAQAGKEVASCPGHVTGVYSVGFSADGRRFLSAGGQRVCIWDLR